MRVLIDATPLLLRAAGLIAISESTKADTIRVLGLASERIEVIYPGVSDAFFGARPTARKKPYILFVGTLEPRKNVDVLLDAYAGLPMRAGYDLVVAGPVGWADTSTVRRLRSGIAGVDYLGYVPEQELPGLTAGATVFVYPSLYEGFGLPVAQAMAAGAPVITSNISSLPEVTGDAALFVDPRSAAQIRAALQKVLSSERLPKEMSEKGRIRAREYRWEVCAR